MGFFWWCFSVFCLPGAAQHCNPQHQDFHLQCRHSDSQHIAHAQHALRLPPAFRYHLPCCLTLPWLIKLIRPVYFLIDSPSPAWEKASMQLRANTCLETSATFRKCILFSPDNKILWLKELSGIGIVIKRFFCPTSPELTNSLLAVSGKEALLKSFGYFCIAK